MHFYILGIYISAEQWVLFLSLDTNSIHLSQNTVH